MNINFASIVNTKECINNLDDAFAYLRNKVVFGVDTVDEEELRKEMDAKILRKLKAGKRLSGEEMRYLKQYNPELYMQAMRVEIKRRSVEEQLKHAASKEEVADIQMMALGSISKKDPAREYMVAAVKETISEFKETAYYKRLPAERENGKKQVNKVRNSLNKKEDDNEILNINYEIKLGTYQMTYADNVADISAGFQASS